MRACLVLVALAGVVAAQDFHPIIPRTWDEQALATLQIPTADPKFAPVHVSADFYYRMPVRPVYKSYPVYPASKEPPGYLDWLKQQAPQVVFDPARLRSQGDWIRAGALVFDAPIDFGNIAEIGLDQLPMRNADWLDRVRAPLAKDGSLPFYSYVIQEKGKVRLGILSCGMCHSRVMPDGSVIKGAQGNFPFDRAFAYDMRHMQAPVETLRGLERALYGAPWIQPDPLARFDDMSKEDIAAVHDAIPPGVLARHGAGPRIPVQVPDLIGVRDRRHLDRTGLVLHRDVGDLMRYAALNQDADVLSRYGDFTPIAALFGKVPEPRELSRYSDEQLYALALFLYSLRPPPNPNPSDIVSERGARVFQREGCATCHKPPLYTNNQLIAVTGFRPPAAHVKKYVVDPFPVGADTGLALKTRRGTGYYKVPSLRGVWYRGPFEHNGSVEALEDWFDPARLKDDYEPTGFIGHGVKRRAVKGHPFGLSLIPRERRALIAYLKTL